MQEAIGKLKGNISIKQIALVTPYLSVLYSRTKNLGYHLKRKLSRALSTIRIISVAFIGIIILTGILFYFSLNPLEGRRPTSLFIEGGYKLIFNQTSICPANTALGGDYFAPWSVTLTNQNDTEKMTIVQPPGSPVTTRDAFLSGSPQNKQYASISFMLPNGTYGYTINPVGFDVNRTSPAPNTGAVTINGHDAVVNVSFIPASCGFVISSKATCLIQRVSVFSVMMVSTSESSTHTYGTTTAETFNVTTVTTNTSLTEQAGYRETTTFSASSTETITGAITVWYVQACTWES